MSPEKPGKFYLGQGCYNAKKYVLAGNETMPCDKSHAEKYCRARRSLLIFDIGFAPGRERSRAEIERSMKAHDYIRRKNDPGD
jgi:hypothetical protein